MNMQLRPLDDRHRFWKHRGGDASRWEALGDLAGGHPSHAGLQLAVQQWTVDLKEVHAISFESVVRSGGQVDAGRLMLSTSNGDYIAEDVAGETVDKMTAAWLAVRSWNAP